MINIALIFFPGQNTELETIRAIEAAGMHPTLVRWNEPLDNLQTFDGFIIAGGFSYEDRGRAGLIASLDPMLSALKGEAAKGKPVLGICNGAQILVESGMIPGAKEYELSMALARNKRMRGGQVLGTGYYNAWVSIKVASKPTRCAFTLALKPGEIYKVPVAHAEGRFTTIHPKLIETLCKREQVIFQYCDAEGNVKEDFPVNPNGAMQNIAAVCNPEGNVMAIMPHLERGIAAPLLGLFSSMKRYCSGKKGWRLFRPKPLVLPKVDALPRKIYKPKKSSLQFHIDLIITDNEAYTLEETARRMGHANVTIARQTYFEVDLKEESEWERKARSLITCGEMLNTNKERPSVLWQKKRYEYQPADRMLMARKAKLPAKWTFAILVQEKQDFVGMNVKATLKKRLHFEWVRDVKKGTLWHVTIAEKSQAQAKKVFHNLVRLHLFANPHAQDSFLYTA